MSDHVPYGIETSSTIEVRRAFRLVGCLAKYVVFIDGASVGEAKTGSTTRFPVPSALHQVQVWNRAQNLSSEPVALALAAGQTVSLVCRSNPSAVLNASFGFRRGPRRYVQSLREIREAGYVVEGGIDLSIVSNGGLT